MAPTAENTGEAPANSGKIGQRERPMSMAVTSPLAVHCREDGAVMALVAKGDHHGVLALYHEHAADVYRFIARRLEGPPEDAEELLQDTMIAAVASASRFRGECSVRTWLCSIARRQIQQRRRTEMRKKRIPAACTLSMDEDSMEWIRAASADGQTIPIDVVENMAVQEIVRRILDGLDEAQREILLMRYVDEFSVRDIAQILQKSERAVEGLLRRARQRAREIGARFE